MQIITLDTESQDAPHKLQAALQEMTALQVSGTTWLLYGQRSAAGLLDMLVPLLPDPARDALLICSVDPFAEIQWKNSNCSDDELGGLIRLERESGAR